ncbi:MAG: hypothetical protein ACHQM6_02305 [Candidatus Kapaibacterium sp.]
MNYFIVAVFSLVILPSLLEAQPLIDTLKHGTEISGTRLIRLQPRAGEVFHYHVVTKSLVTAQNSDELLDIANLRPDDKSTYSINYYMTASVRKIRDDGASDFQVRIDSIRSAVNDNGKIQSFTTSRREDTQDPFFEDRAIFAGNDFGLITDSLGNFKEVYGFYTIADELVSRLTDSLQSAERIDSISDDVRGSLRKILHHIFCYLPKDAIAKHDSSNSSWKDDIAVWSTLQFPMQKEYKEIVAAIEERDGKPYAVFSSETGMTPVERVLDEPEYHTTLPTFSYVNTDRYYVDCSNGMLAFDKWTEDQSYGMKIESKLPEKSGKSFVTVQHSKVETVVELMR